MSDKAIEILKSAIMLERRGKAFYTQAAETARSPEVREIFRVMAKEEDLRANRLRLLAYVRSLFGRVADLSKVVIEGQ